MFIPSALQADGKVLVGGIITDYRRTDEERASPGYAMTPRRSRSWT